VSDKDVCGRYDSARSRYCRNKPYSVRTLWDGREAPGSCRRHTIEDLERFEKDNRELAYYLRYRHLLESSGDSSA
jgi:hypothetical protein